MELTIEQKLLAIEALSKAASISGYGQAKDEAEKKLLKLIKSIEIPNIIATIEVDIKPTQTKEPTFKIETKEQLEKTLNELNYDFAKKYPCDAWDFIIKKFAESKFPEPDQESDIYKKVKSEAKSHLDNIYHNYCNNSLSFKDTILKYITENL